MAIRLNKVIRELNIGLSTAVEFLQKRKELGDVEETPSFKLNDEQYAALVEAFKKDRDVRTQADKIFPKKNKEKKKEKEPESHRAETLLDSNRQQVRQLGSIDLANVGKPQKPAEPQKPKDTAPAQPAKPVKKEEPKVEPPVVKQEPAAKEEEPEKVTPKEEPSVEETKKAEAPFVEVVQPEEQPKEQPAAAEKATPQPESSDVSDVSDKSDQSDQSDQSDRSDESDESDQLESSENDESARESGEPEIFAIPIEQANAPKVIGKIDLGSVDQRTRPRKKTKEELRKEREKKAQQQHAGTTGTGEKRKRSRIGGRERVDIAAASQSQGQGQTQSQGQGGKNKGKKNKQKPKAPVRSIEVNEEDVARQVRETLARLTSKGQNKKGAKYRKEKREAVQERLQEEQAEARAESKILKLTEFVTVSELATMMNVAVTQVIGTCMSIGIMVSINQRLDAETINIVADEFGFKTEYVSAEVQNAITEEEDDENDLVPRAPIVTVMGHVDHGKTSLLDYIRKTNVIAGEAGGITQHIGAYNVELSDGRQITFLDTPGHEAFTAMRARGAQVTDIAIIIVAADDSVMPTTKEAIAHAQAANVPMVFAINKIDKPGANPDKIREDLANMNLLVEDWGGKYQCQEISAKKGIGVDDLLEKVLLEAEMLDLKANPNRKATGSIIESSLDKGRGYVSTVLVSNGTLKVGDIVVAGTSFGRIKAMFNERNQRIQEAGPAEPAIILGLNGAPTAGDTFHVMSTEQEARDITNKRLQLQREQGLRTTKKFGLDELSHRIALGEFHELNIIVKGDTDGSIEALSDSFIKLSTEKVQVNVINKAVGQISENDVMLASASKAIIVGFQVRPSAEARKLAEREGVEINTYSIIYDAIDEVRSTMQGMLDKVKKEVITAEIEVKQVFKISKVGTVAGGLVTDGKVHNKDKARVVRDGIVVHTAPISALKRYKDDAKEVATGLECGISLVNFNDIQVGDIIETFMEIEVEQKL